MRFKLYTVLHMTLDTVIMAAGLLVIVVQFLGLPASWDDMLYLVLGAFVIGLGIYLRRRRVQVALEEKAKQD